MKEPNIVITGDEGWASSADTQLLPVRDTEQCVM